MIMISWTLTQLVDDRVVQECTGVDTSVACPEQLQQRVVFGGYLFCLLDEVLVVGAE